MSDSKQLWYHPATNEWREVPPVGTWPVAHVATAPDHRAVIDQLQRENAALRTELKDAAMKGLKVALKAQAADLSDLQRENAALVEAFAKADVLAEYMRSDGRREWAVVETWIQPNQIIVLMDRAAFDAARAKEDKP